MLDGHRARDLQVRLHGRRQMRGEVSRETAFTHAREDVEVEEVHEAQHEQHEADLGAEALHSLLGVAGGDAVAQGQGDVTDVDEVEADDEEVVDVVGQFGVSPEAVDEEDASVAVEGARHPDGEGDADGEVGEVSPNDEVHNRAFLFSFVAQQ